MPHNILATVCPLACRTLIRSALTEKETQLIGSSLLAYLVFGLAGAGCLGNSVSALSPSTLLIRRCLLSRFPAFPHRKLEGCICNFRSFF